MKKQGNVLLEFLVALPIFMMITYGLIELILYKTGHPIQLLGLHQTQSVIDSKFN
jgi:hypothetical protein